MILGLGATIEARDPSTNGHCQRLAYYATKLGSSLGLDRGDLGALERGGFLHDIGKIAVPDSVLLKDGTLDRQESRVMRKHPIVGDSLCAGLRSLNKVWPIVRHHHERLDGTGYPDGCGTARSPCSRRSSVSSTSSTRSRPSGRTAGRARARRRFRS